MSFLGLGSSKKKSFIDDKTSGAQWANYAGAQALPANYSPTSEAQINSYFSPYAKQVVDTSLDALERSRERAINDTNDRAVAAKAFGGSRHGVAEALTNEGYANQAAQTAAQLYDRDYAQALAAAQDENKLSFFYPLQRQGMLNETLRGVTPITVGKTQDPGQAFSNFGKVFSTGSKIMSFFG